MVQVPEGLHIDDPKKTGSFYTPFSTADFISRKTIEHWLQRVMGDIPVNQIVQSEKSKKRAITYLRDIRVLDPAVGDGVFLIAAAEAISDLRTKLDDKTSSSDMLGQILTESLYGVDVQETAASACLKNLTGFASSYGIDIPVESLNIRLGNSLIGQTTSLKDPDSRAAFDVVEDAFHWQDEFPEVMCREPPGFDVIIGNPPYGNILTREEQDIISMTYQNDVSKGRTGSWNSAAVFISRAHDLSRPGGQLGFLVPNSILRVGQFSKTRQFLLTKTGIWMIVDEGDLFEAVTLEMVSIFTEFSTDRQHKFRVVSRRSEIDDIFSVPQNGQSRGEVIVLYHDEILEHLSEVGLTGQLLATRGRDIPKSHTRTGRDNVYKIPYATSGRSVKRYHFDYDYFKYADDWFEDNRTLSESYENEFLVATKNYPYPRCVIKPRGIVHGGGIVRIIPTKDKYDESVIGLILNSRLARYICTRYLTNYSQLTTCLNTGIMDNFPLVYPSKTSPFSSLFSLLSDLYQEQTKQKEDQIVEAERIANALVYELYFDEELRLQGLLSDRQPEIDSLESFQEVVESTEVAELVEDIMLNDDVNAIEHSPRM